MTISLYSNWWLKQGNEEMMKPVFKSLAEDILRSEAGTLTYMVNYPVLDFSAAPQFISEPFPRPGAITFMERYASWDAFDAHVNGPIFQGFLAKYGQYFVQAAPTKEKPVSPFIQVVFLDMVAGFVERSPDEVASLMKPKVSGSRA